MSEKLRNCPFCGVEETDIGFIAHTNECYLMRRYMGVSTKEELHISWNTRPIEDALQQRIDELEHALVDVLHIGEKHQIFRAHSTEIMRIRKVLNKESENE